MLEVEELRMTKDDSAERKTLNLVNNKSPPQPPVSEPTRGSASILADWPVRTDAPWQVHQEPNTAVAPTFATPTRTTPIVYSST